MRESGADAAPSGERADLNWNLAICCGAAAESATSARTPAPKCASGLYGTGVSCAGSDALPCVLRADTSWNLDARCRACAEAKSPVTAKTPAPERAIELHSAGMFRTSGNDRPVCSGTNLGRNVLQRR